MIIALSLLALAVACLCALVLADVRKARAADERCRSFVCALTVARMKVRP